MMPESVRPALGVVEAPSPLSDALDRAEAHFRDAEDLTEVLGHALDSDMVDPRTRKILGTQVEAIRKAAAAGLSELFKAVEAA